MSKQYNRGGESSIPMQVQKVYSTPFHLCIAVRAPGKTTWIWLGRQKPFMGIFKCDSPPHPKFRIIDIVTQWARSRIKGKWLESIEVSTGNSLLILREVGGNNVLSLGYINNSLNFIDAVKQEDAKYKVSLSTSEHTKIEDGVDLSSYFQDLSIEEQDPVKNLDRWLLKNKKQERKKTESKIARKIKNIEGDLEKLRSFKELYEIAKNEKALMQSNILEHRGIKIKFFKSQTFHQRSDKVYQKAKRLKGALHLQEERLEKERARLKNKIDNEVVSIKPINLKWKLVQSEKTAMTASSEESKDKSLQLNFTAGLVAQIGLSAQGNDFIRKTWAKKDDIWAHIENVTGSHIFIRGNEIVDQMTWELIGSALRDFSHYKGEQITLVWTKVRNLRAVKGSPGLVRFTKEKRITVNYNKEWRNLL